MPASGSGAERALMRADRLVVAVWLGLLLASLGVAVWLWRELEGVAIAPEGWLALAAGALLTIAVGVGLVRLMFISHKRGFDERAHHEGE